jgi:hypothetical protein
MKAGCWQPCLLPRQHIAATVTLCIGGGQGIALAIERCTETAEESVRSPRLLLESLRSWHFEFSVPLRLVLHNGPVSHHPGGIPQQRAHRSPTVFAYDFHQRFLCLVPLRLSVLD